MSERSTIKAPLDQATLNTNATLPKAILELLGGELRAIAVIPLNPVTGKFQLPIILTDGTTPTSAAEISVMGNANIGSSGSKLLRTGALMAFSNVASTNYEQARTPTIFKNAAPAAAPATTDVWTPAGGKKFRLMGGVISMSGSIAAVALRTLKLIEETAGTVIVELHLDIPVTGGSVAVNFTIPGNGFLASTVDKKLQAVTAGGTYVTGTDAVSVWGTEE